MKLFKLRKKENNCCENQNKEVNYSCCGIQSSISNDATSKIIVLGSCCSKSTQTFENVKIAAKQLGINDEISNIGDHAQIASYGVMSTPALVVNGKVLSSGRKLSIEDAKKLISKEI